MKTLILFIGLMIACNGSDKSKLFPGTYVRSSEHEFGKEYDTLVITEFMDQYKIIRKWRYERVLDGVVQQPVYKVKVTTAYYEDKYRLLHENETGKRISIDKGEGILIVGATKFKKI